MDQNFDHAPLKDMSKNCSEINIEQEKSPLYSTKTTVTVKIHVSFFSRWIPGIWRGFCVRELRSCSNTQPGAVLRRLGSWRCDVRSAVSDKGVKGRRDRKVRTGSRKKLRRKYTRCVYVLIMEKIKIYFVNIIVAIIIETSIRYMRKFSTLFFFLRLQTCVLLI